MRASLAMVPSTPPAPALCASLAPTAWVATTISPRCVQRMPLHRLVLLRWGSATVPLATLATTARLVHCVLRMPTVMAACPPAVHRTVLLRSAPHREPTAGAMLASMLQTATQQLRGVCSVRCIPTAWPRVATGPRAQPTRSRPAFRPRRRNTVAAIGATLASTTLSVWLVWRDSGAGTAYAISVPQILPL